MMKFENNINKKMMAIGIIAVMCCAGLVLMSDDSSAEVTSGSCGENLTWSYDSDNTTLTISGEGTAIQDYTSAGSPWHNLNVTNVVFDCPNLTTIGAYAFADSNISVDKLPYKITTINEGAFKNCLMLSLIKLPDQLTTIGNGAFEHCIRLAIQTVPYGVTSIGANVFKDCMGITVMIIPRSITSIDDMAFDGTTGLTTIANLSSVDISGKFPYMTHEITATINGEYALRGWKWYLFEDISTWYMDGDQISDYDWTYSNQAQRDWASNTSLKYAIFNARSMEHLMGYVFNQNSSLESVILPDSLKTIGSNCFAYCTSLTELDFNLQAGVESIGVNAAQYCTNLTTVRLPNSLRSIGGFAFAYDPNLILTELPESLIEIGRHAFNGDTKISFTKLPDGITTIYDYTFSDCTALALTELPENLTTIQEGAFKNCTNITISKIPNGVTTIPKGCFAGCTSLSTMHIPSSLTSIYSSGSSQDYAFYNTNIELIYNESNLNIRAGQSGMGNIASKSKFVYTGVFVGDNIYRVNDDNTATFLAPTGEQAIQSSFTIPDSVVIGGTRYSISAIGDGAFYIAKSTLTNVNIPNGITTIGVRAFEGCSLLSEVTVPQTVTAINTDAFKGCISLKTVYNESNLNIVAGSDTYGYVGYYADVIYNGRPYGDFLFSIIDESHARLIGFIGDTATADTVTIPGNVELSGQQYVVSAIGNGLFKDNTTIVSVTLPGTILTIGNEVFMGATSLTTINGLGSVEYVGVSAFEGTTVVIPVSEFSSLTAVGNYAFEDSAIDWTVLPDTLTDIGDSAFDGSNIAITVIPATVEIVGDYAFANTPNIDNYIIIQGNVQLGDHLFNDNADIYGVVLYDNPQISTNTFTGAGFTEVLNLSEIEDLSPYNGLNTCVIANSFDALSMIQQKEDIRHEYVPDDSTSSKLLRMIPIFIVLSLLGAVAYGIYRKNDNLFE